MQPSPIDETTGPTVPNFRSFIARKSTPAFAPRASAWQARLRPTGFGVAGPPSPCGLRRGRLQFAPEGLMTRAITVIVLGAALAGAQEHSYTPADIENGARLYQSSCAGCHGPTGDLVPGIDLQRGQFRRATTDTELIRIIVSGIPGATMPPSSFSETQAGAIVAFLRSARTGGSLAGAGTNPAAAAGRGGGLAATTGNAAGGKALFEGRGACATCHRVGASGPRIAPDLTDIGTVRQPGELQQKL